MSTFAILFTFIRILEIMHQYQIIINELIWDWIRGKQKLYQGNRDLLKEINERKTRLYETARKKGLANDETIKHSQELDQLIFQYQRKTHKNPKRKEEKKTVLQHMMYMMPAVLAKV